MLTITGVIATILSLIFAGAAIWNSRVRRGHLQRLEDSADTDTRLTAAGDITFTPPPPAMPDTTPTPAAAPANPTPTASPLEKPLEEPQALFRQIKPGEIGNPDVAIEKDNAYVWE